VKTAEEGRLAVVDTEDFKPSPSLLSSADKRLIPIGGSPTKYRPSRPALARKHRSSTSFKLEDSAQRSPDWLTGDDTFSIIKPINPSRSPLRRRTSSTTAPKISPSSSSTISAQPSIPTAPTVENVTSTSQAEATRAVTAAQRPFPPRSTDGNASRDPMLQDSSSDEGEGPEDVNMRIIKNREIRRPKGRQSSVHDLVDLYGGAPRAPVAVSRDRTGATAPLPLAEKKERRMSDILVDVSLPSAPALTAAPSSGLLSPDSIIPESREELAGRMSAFGTRPEGGSSSPMWVESKQPNSRPSSRLGGSPSRTSPIRSSSPARRASPLSNQVLAEQSMARSRTPPFSSPTDRLERPRPQSMFLFSPSKPSAEPSILTPPEEPRQARATRRGSISDMVNLYENLSSVKKNNEPPPIAQKPLGLKPKTPSPVLTRFPPVSPSGVSFIPTQMILPPEPSPKLKPRRSPTAGSLASITDSNDSSSEPAKTRSQFVSRVPRRQSISPNKRTPAATSRPAVAAMPAPVKPAKPVALSIHASASVRPSSPVKADGDPMEDASTPSPFERPYQGVSRLIDQWQRKTEEANRSVPPRVGRPMGPRAKRETGQNVHAE